MRKANLSSYFLTPMLNLKATVSQNVFESPHFEDTYLRDRTFENEELGEHFYFLFKDNLPEDMVKNFERHPLFTEKYSPEEGKVMFKFKVPEKYIETVVKPFLQGKYSRVDKDFVDEFFPNDPHSKSYGNRLVFEKHPQIRAIVEEKIGMALPDDAEVWDRPLESNETYVSPSQLFDPEATPTPTA